MTSPTPLVPAGYDLTWSIFVIVLVVLLVVALVSLARAAKRLTTGQALGWTLLTVLVPIIGPISWLAIGRRSLA